MQAGLGVKVQLAFNERIADGPSTTVRRRPHVRTFALGSASSDRNQAQKDR
jgi:hypothetical protein